MARLSYGILLAIAVGVASLPPASAINILTNPGFEESSTDIVGWSTFSFESSSTIDTTMPHTGSNAVVEVGGTAFSGSTGVFQRYGVDDDRVNEGEIYRVSVWAKAGALPIGSDDEFNGANLRLVWEEDGGTDIYMDAIALGWELTTDYQQFSAEYTAPFGAEQLLFGLYSRHSDQAIYFDDASLELVPGLDDTVVTATIDRGSGNLTLTNGGIVDADIRSYSITSAFGSLAPGSWTSIAGHYDEEANGGDESVDSDDPWTIESNSYYDLSEAELSGGDGGTIGIGPPPQTVDLGNIWTKSPHEDLVLEVELTDGSSAITFLEFEGGPNDAPFERSDLTFDSFITEADWNIFRMFSLADLSGMSPAEAYQHGDLDGDGDSDVIDFGLFKNDFDAANGAGAFGQMLGVPEPSTMILFGVVALGALVARRQRFRSIARGTVLGALAALGCLAGFCHATTIGFVGAGPTNSDLPVDYGSNLGADGTGWTVSDGTGVTPDVALYWGGTPGGDGWDWEAHNAGTFQYIEALNAGGGWDATGPPSTNAVAQLQDQNDAPHEINFSVTPGAALVLHSFDIGNATDQTGGESPYGFDIALVRDSDSATVWSHSTPLWDVEDAGPPRVLREESVSVDYTGDLGESYTLVFTRTPDTGVTWRSGLDNLSFSQFPLSEPLSATVDRGTGNVTLSNDTDDSISFDYYQLTSDLGSLDPDNWRSLYDQDLDDFPAGDGSGDGWEEAGGSSDEALGELYLRGSSALAAGASVSLGKAYDKNEDRQDVFLSYRTAQGIVTDNIVPTYVFTTPDADFDDDGDVDGNDFLIWQQGFGVDGRGDADGDGDTDGNDFLIWQQNFGAGSGAASVPEPAAMWLLLLAGAIAAMRRSRAA